MNQRFSYYVLLVMTSQKPQTALFRRWLSFRLRTLFVMFTLVGCGLGWVGRFVHQHRIEQAVLAQLAENGGFVTELRIQDGPFGRADPFYHVWLT